MNKRIICTDAAFMMKSLKEEFKEEVFAMAITENRSTLLFFKDKDNSSMSLLEVFPNNIGCMISAGKDFQTLD